MKANRFIMPSIEFALWIVLFSMFSSIILQFSLLVPISALVLLINQTNLYNLIIPKQLTFWV